VSPSSLCGERHPIDDPLFGHLCVLSENHIGPHECICEVTLR
jgi:hypothetical protein